MFARKLVLSIVAVVVLTASCGQPKDESAEGTTEGAVVEEED